MDTLIKLLLQYLPSQIEAIKLLRFVPDAVDTVKELVELVKRTIEVLKQSERLTPEQQFALDASIAALSTDPDWQEDQPIPNDR